MCAHCEKAFEGRRHYEKRGMAYCERDYKFVREAHGSLSSSVCLLVSYCFHFQLFGDVCFSCSKPCRGDGEWAAVVMVRSMIV